MPADLGNWPAEQATVLLEVLQKAGLTPEARRTREGVHVTVPDEQGDKAHTTLVQHMDTIAKAARPPAGQRRRARDKGRPDLRAVPGGKAGRGGNRRQPAMSSERLRRLGSPLGIVLVALLLGAAVPAFRIIAPVAMVAALIYVLGKQAQRGDP